MIGVDIGGTNLLVGCIEQNEVIQRLHQQSLREAILKLLQIKFAKPSLKSAQMYAMVSGYPLQEVSMLLQALS